MCKYCEDDVETFDLEEIDGRFWISHCIPHGNKMETVLYYKRHDVATFTDIEINYCPFCGRKLVSDAEN